MKQSEIIEMISRNHQKLEESLEQYCPVSIDPGTHILNTAIHDALFPGGKRMRPLCMLVAYQCLGGDLDEALPLACAVEYLHNSSLILDDLPAMDNALLRRCRPCLHHTHGVGISILAALALLNQAYALFSQNDQARELTGMLCDCIGTHGLISGQAIDLAQSSPDSVSEAYYKKTTSLTRLMMTSVGILVRSSPAQQVMLGQYGEDFGRAYQMLDDMMDSSSGRDERVVQQARKLMAESNAGLDQVFPDGRLRPMMSFVDDVLERFLQESMEQKP